MKLSRNAKRSVIISIYLIIFVLIVYFFVSLFSVEETCFDGILNQNEEEVDCGGLCKKCEKISIQEIRVEDAEFVFDGNSNYDFVARISNPNSRYGSERFSYEFILRDNSGNILTSRRGESFILPLEKKYLIETNIPAGVLAYRVEIVIGEASWKEFSDYERPRLVISNQKYGLGDGGFGEAYGLLRNESSFDLGKVRVNVVLRDSFGKIVALNKTEATRVLAGEDRDFKLIWPQGFLSNPGSVEMEAETNVFDDLNFLKTK